MNSERESDCGTDGLFRDATPESLTKQTLAEINAQRFVSFARQLGLQNPQIEVEFCQDAYLEEANSSAAGYSDAFSRYQQEDNRTREAIRALGVTGAKKSMRARWYELNVSRKMLRDYFESEHLSSIQTSVIVYITGRSIGDVTKFIILLNERYPDLMFQGYIDEDISDIRILEFNKYQGSIRYIFIDPSA